MTDFPPLPHTDDAGVAPGRGAATGMARWQKLVGIIGIVVVLWVGSRMSNIVFDDGPGPGSNTPVESQGEEHSAPGPGDHGPGGDG